MRLCMSCTAGCFGQLADRQCCPVGRVGGTQGEAAFWAQLPEAFLLRMQLCSQMFIGRSIREVVREKRHPLFTGLGCLSRASLHRAIGGTQIATCRGLLGPVCAKAAFQGLQLKTCTITLAFSKGCVSYYGAA